MKWDESARRRFSNSGKRAWADPVKRARLLAGKAKVQSEINLRISAGQKGRVVPENIRRQTSARMLLQHEYLSKRAKKMWANPQYREKASQRTHSLATRTKISAGVKLAHQNDPELRAAIGKRTVGKKLSEERKQHLRRCFLGRSNLKLSLALRGKKQSDAVRIKRAESLRAWWRRASPEQKQQRAELARRAWEIKSTEERNKQLSGIRSGKSVSNLEREFLNRVERSTGTMLRRGEIVGRYRPDGLVGRLVLEVDGDYWHSKPGVKRKDLARDKFFVAKGYYVHRAREGEILLDLWREVQRASTAVAFFGRGIVPLFLELFGGKPVRVAPPF